MRRSFIIALIVFAAMNARAADVQRTLATGRQAPALDVEMLDGSRAPDWTAMRGNVVVLDFWATWCHPCATAIPHLNALSDELRGQPVRFFSITYEPRKKALAFLETHPMKTAVALDHGLATFASFLAWGIPMAYVIDGRGAVAAIVNPETLTAAAIRDVLAGRKPDLPQHPGWADPAGAAKYFRDQLDEDRKKYGD
jgi:thiol-disulfide isomerase/thioredoxin